MHVLTYYTTNMSVTVDFKSLIGFHLVWFIWNNEKGWFISAEVLDVKKSPDDIQQTNEIRGVINKITPNQTEKVEIIYKL